MLTCLGFFFICISVCIFVFIYIFIYIGTGTGAGAGAGIGTGTGTGTGIGTGTGTCTGVWACPDQRLSNSMEFLFGIVSMKKDSTQSQSQDRVFLIIKGIADLADR